ncbi:hypothetical protein PHLCEN_2v12788 [Hermanssonia centrifuga]|uniref:Uncharacterized protein n=1 Tax=Hermanssonia centrifuga TaxID=98765 RepID=A0A2R6NFV7_9APHY|nr:hypothetical protein PHLCEN_2v12788 [Hermanssonia centrifuga]
MTQLILEEYKEIYSQSMKDTRHGSNSARICATICIGDPDSSRTHAAELILGLPLSDYHS